MSGDEISKSAESVVFCVDGITSSIIKHVTPDVSWHAYVQWLRSRRPDLSVVHMEQPYDWVEIFSGQPDAYEQRIGQLVNQAFEQLHPGIRNVLVLGFSLGGLTALYTASRIARLRPDINFEYVAFVTFGTPFMGTARIADKLIRHLPYDYFRRMLDVENTKRWFRGLLESGDYEKLRILIGEIEHDEMVSASSSLAPVHWLTSCMLPASLKWGTFVIKCGNELRPHDGLLHDPLALAYTDGLVDGLFPHVGLTNCYEPFPGNKPHLI